MNSNILAAIIGFLICGLAMWLDTYRRKKKKFKK